MSNINEYLFTKKIYIISKSSKSTINDHSHLSIFKSNIWKTVFVYVLHVTNWQCQVSPQRINRIMIVIKDFSRIREFKFLKVFIQWQASVALSQA